MDDPLMHDHDVIIDWDAVDLEIGRQWRENSSLEKWFPFTAEQLATLTAENAALKDARDECERQYQQKVAALAVEIDKNDQLKAQLAAAEPAEYQLRFKVGEGHKWISVADQAYDEADPQYWERRELFTTPPQHAAALPECYRQLLLAATGLTFGTDWNSGTHAKRYRNQLIAAAKACAEFNAVNVGTDGHVDQEQHAAVRSGWDVFNDPKPSDVLEQHAARVPEVVDSLQAIANVVCEKLPEGYTLSVWMENGAAWVELDEGGLVPLPDAADKYLMVQVYEALETALAAPTPPAQEG